jgi:hypothetical protein
MINAHALDAESFGRHYAGTEIDSEWVSIQPTYDCDRAVLKVKFPARFRPNKISVQATAEYIPSPFQGLSDPRFIARTTRIHDLETDRIHKQLEQEGNTFVLSIDDPVPAMTYKISWKFETSATGLANLQEIAIVEANCRALLESIRENVTAVTDQIEKTTDELKTKIRSIISKDDHKLKVSLMIFDDERNQLVTIWPPEMREKLTLYSGEGCAGFAFEKVRSVLYHPSKDPHGLFIRSAELQDGSDQTDPAVLLSFPWVHAATNVKGINKVVGVMNLSTVTKTSGLLSLFDDPERAAVMQKIQNLVTESGREMMCTIN